MESTVEKSIDKIENNRKITSQFELFESYIKFKLKKIYSDYSKIIKDKPGLITKAVNLIVRLGLRSAAADAGGKIASAASGNKDIGSAVSAGINLLALIVFYLKDISDDAILKAAKAVEANVKKAGGIDEFAKKIANYAKQRFFYLIIALAEETDGSQQIKSLAKFFISAAVGLLLETDIDIGNLEENIVPNEDSKIYDDNFFKIFSISKRIKYGNESYDLKDVLLNTPAIADNNGLLILNKKYKYYHLPQRLKDKFAELLGYYRDAPEINALILHNSNNGNSIPDNGYKVSADFSKEDKKYIIERKDKLKMNYKIKKLEYIKLYYEFFKKRCELVNIINDINENVSRNEKNKLTIKEELIVNFNDTINSYVDHIFLFYYHLLFDILGSDSNKFEYIYRENFNFLKKEVAWLHGLNLSFFKMREEFLLLIKVNYKKFKLEKRLNYDVREPLDFIEKIIAYAAAKGRINSRNPKSIKVDKVANVVNYLVDPEKLKIAKNFIHSIILGNYKIFPHQ